MDNNDTKGVELMEVVTGIVTNEWFLLIAGLASIISLIMAFVVKSKSQNQSGSNNQQAGRDINNV